MLLTSASFLLQPFFHNNKNPESSVRISISIFHPYTRSQLRLQSEMSALTPPAGGDVDRALTANIIGWIFVGLAIVTVSLRFWGRIMIKSLGKDDWTMLAALVIQPLLAL